MKLIRFLWLLFHRKQRTAGRRAVTVNLEHSTSRWAHPTNITLSFKKNQLFHTHDARIRVNGGGGGGKGIDLILAWGNN